LAADPVIRCVNAWSHYRQVSLLDYCSTSDNITCYIRRGVGYWSEFRHRDYAPSSVNALSATAVGQSAWN